jgi:hypothetical protein
LNSNHKLIEDKSTNSKIDRDSSRKEVDLKVSNITKSLGFDLEKIIVLIEKEDFRLAAILKDSKIQYIDNLINIYNKYKFNLSYIQKNECMQVLKRIFTSELNNDNLTFNIEHDNIGGDVKEVVNKKSREDEAITKSGDNQAVSSISNELLEKTTESMENKASNKDNSSLVENIL